ncbi:MAG: hypothetical protein AAGB00_11380 [Planctomycetota bacterium]
MEESLVAWLLFAISWAGAAGLTWFLASRQKLFIATFVPRDEWHGFLIGQRKRPGSLQNGLRLIAVLQLVVLAIACVVALLLPIHER